MTGEVFALFADYLSEPLTDAGIIHVVVVDPPLIAGVVGRIDVDKPDAAFILRQQGFQRFQVVAVNDHIAVILPGRRKRVLPL